MTDGPGGTAQHHPAVPRAAVEAVFGHATQTALRFAGHLAGSGVERGLIGPREVPRLWERHLLNCAVVETLVPEGAAVADVGSGAGLPGIALGIVRPDIAVTLVEPLQRRVSWLDEVLDDLALPNVRVERARAEELRGRRSFDVVTARAVAALPALGQWCLPLLEPGGLLLALKGRSAQQEAESAARDLERSGASGWEVVTCGDGVLEVPTTVVVVTRSLSRQSRARSTARRSSTAGSGSGRAARGPRPPRA
jgi:16S rRNA (guanine527-N7)-methyltransferase